MLHRHCFVSDVRLRRMRRVWSCTENSARVCSQSTDLTECLPSPTTPGRLTAATNHLVASSVTASRVCVLSCLVGVPNQKYLYFNSLAMFDSLGDLLRLFPLGGVSGPDSWFRGKNDS